MKIKSDYILREVAGTCVAVPTGRASLDFSGMISLNGTGAFLWKQLLEEKNEQELLFAMLEEYATDEASAEADIKDFIRSLREVEILE